MASSRVSKKPKTVRSIAIDKDTLAKILELAEEQKISFNALLESMIMYYADIACYGGSIGLTHIEHPNLKLILGCIDTNCLNNAPAAGSRDSWEIWAELRGMKRDLPSFFKVLQYHERMGWGVIKVTGQENRYKIVFSHTLGESWTIFMMKWFEAGYEYMVGKKIPADKFKMMSNGFSVAITG